MEMECTVSLPGFMEADSVDGCWEKPSDKGWLIAPTSCSTSCFTPTPNYIKYSHNYSRRNPNPTHPCSQVGIFQFFIWWRWEERDNQKQLKEGAGSAKGGGGYKPLCVLFMSDWTPADLSYSKEECRGQSEYWQNRFSIFPFFCPSIHPSVLLEKMKENFSGTFKATPGNSIFKISMCCVL